MWKKIYCAILVFCLLLTGCDKIAPQKSYKDVKKELDNIRSYTCEVLIKTSNNKSTVEYRHMHIYKKPDKFRVETIEPEALKGQVILFNGKTAYIYYPVIEQYMVTENLSGSIEHDAFIGSFVKHFEDNEKSSVNQNKFHMDKSGEVPYYVIETKIPGGSRYRDSERLWLDAARRLPVKTEILDVEGKAVIQIFYSNFKTNINLDDKLFEINKS